MRFGIHHGAMAIEISHYLRRRIYDREPNIVNQLFAIRGVSIYVYKSMDGESPSHGEAASASKL